MAKAKKESKAASSDKKEGFFSARVDPKFEWAVEFAIDLLGAKKTTIIERVMRDWANEQRLKDGTNWSDYWHPEPGVRRLKVLANKNYPSTLSDDELRDFCETHWEFFYTGPDKKEPYADFVRVLWGDVDTYHKLWRQTMKDAPWSAGKKMAEAIRRCDIEAPVWPRKGSHGK